MKTTGSFGGRGLLDLLVPLSNLAPLNEYAFSVFSINLVLLIGAKMGGLFGYRFDPVW